MSASIDRTPRTGYLMVPNGLWTQPLSNGARVVICWLHSHTPEYLAGLSRNAIMRGLGMSASAVDRALAELDQAGALELTTMEKRAHISLWAGWWEALHAPIGNRSPSPRADRKPITPDRKPITNRSETDRVVDQGEDQREDHTHSSAAVASPGVALELVPPLPPTARTRKPNPIFEALTDACSMDPAAMTSREQRACAVAAAELVKAGATPDEIRRRAAAHDGRYTLTPSAIANNWSTLGRGAPRKRNVSAGFAFIAELDARERAAGR